MLEWLANMLLDGGAGIAHWFVGSDTASFPVVQMMLATLVLAAVVAAIVYWQDLVKFCETRWARRKQHRAD
jgi:hypothetical protein